MADAMSVSHFCFVDGCSRVGDGKVACLVRRRVGKGIQGACAPMAELALREQRGVLMAAICLPGEVRRPVPGCYLPGGALGVLSVGADASLRAAHCFSIAWISCSSDSWICAS